MNSSEYMDKQITEFSKSQTRNFFLDVDEEDNDGGDDTGDRLQSLAHRPIRPSQSLNKSPDGAPIRGWSSMDGIDSTTFSGERAGNTSDAALVAEIDKKIKEHVDVLLHSLECLSARVSQMESRTRQLENAFDDLKDSIESNHGKTNAKLMELENILTEVQVGVRDLRDKQEIAETHLLLAKLQGSKDDTQLRNQNSSLQASSDKEAFPSVSQQPHQPVSLPVASPQILAFSSNATSPPLQNYTPVTHVATAPQLPTPASPRLPTPASPQLPAPAVTQLPTFGATAPQLPTQLHQNTIPSVPPQESSYSVPVPAAQTMHQQYRVPPPLQPQQSPPNQQSYQPLPYLPPTSQVHQLPQVQPPFTMVNPQVPPPSGHHPEEVPYMPSHNIHPQQPGRPLQLQQFNAVTEQLHDQHSNRHYSESTSASLQSRLQPQMQANITDFYHNSGSPTYRGGQTMKPFQPLPASPISGGESSYSRLPTAQALPRAIPTASAVDTAPASGGNGNRVPVDDVVDKLSSMGFRRDLVRATVKKLTENGQSVDLNVVLDKLMNG